MNIHDATEHAHGGGSSHVEDGPEARRPAPMEIPGRMLGTAPARWTYGRWRRYW